MEDIDDDETKLLKFQFKNLANREFFQPRAFDLNKDHFFQFWKMSEKPYIARHLF